MNKFVVITIAVIFSLCIVLSIIYVQRVNTRITTSGVVKTVTYLPGSWGNDKVTIIRFEDGRVKSFRGHLMVVIGSRNTIEVNGYGNIKSINYSENHK